MKKVLVFLLSVMFCVSCIVPFGANAVVVEVVESDEEELALAADFPLQYWYVDNGYDPYVGRWTKSQIKVYVESQSTWSALSKANLESYVRSAFTKWGIPGKSVMMVSSAALADIEVYGITRAAATAKNIDKDISGLTEWGTSTWQAAIYENSQEVSEFKRLYNMSHAIIYLIEESKLGNATTVYSRLAAHEMGHAFGYYGHYQAGQLMKESMATIYSGTPGLNEKNHLHQLY